MSIQVSVCCLIAVTGRDRYRWPTGFYRKELSEPDALVAQQFVQLDVDREGATIGEAGQVLVVNIHPGHVEHCPEVYEADMEVDPDRETALHPLTEQFTVCGMDAETGQCYSGLWVANGPLMAYAAAYTHFEGLYGHDLLVGAVHPGVQDTAVYATPWADPGCDTQAAMTLRMTELVT